MIIIDSPQCSKNFFNIKGLFIVVVMRLNLGKIGIPVFPRLRGILLQYAAPGADTLLLKDTFPIHHLLCLHQSFPMAGEAAEVMVIHHVISFFPSM
jgi:hypothetical protein